MPAVNQASFVPRRGRMMALASGGLSLLLFALIAWLLPGPAEGGQWGPVDKAMVAGLGVAIAVLMIRYARISATPVAEGLRVRNLMLTRTIAWSEIEGVRFGGGEPWVNLDLIDGESVAVMAIQRADGAAADADAQRLADLVARGGAAEPARD